MKHVLTPLAITIFLLTFFFTARFTQMQTLSGTIEREAKEEAGRDNDWFYTQRSFPREQIPDNFIQKAQATMNSRFGSSKAEGLWVQQGPSNIGGRITAILIDPTNSGIYYVGTAAGGIWRIWDDGSPWQNIFDKTSSIGSLAFDPQNSSIIYAGTGEANPSGVATYPGDGVWKSTDAGETWTNIGLQSTGHIGKIVVDPNNSNEIYAAALGLYRGKTSDRGIYKTTDGGSSWNKILYLNDTTGATDIVIDPLNSSHVLAAMWTRYRTPRDSWISGVASGLFSSTNGGNSWIQDTTGFPHDDPNLGRISLAFAPSSPSIIYALTANSVSWGGIYKSVDGGGSWTKTYGGSGGETQVWYNNVIVVHPNNPNIVWAAMTSIYKSTDGGTTFNNVQGGFHVDHHALAYAPSDPSIMLMGNDGGIYASIDGGGTWTFSPDLPITQFYAGAVDEQHPTHLFGGTQDNGTNRTMGRSDSWFTYYGGDGFYTLVDPTDSNYIYAESQNGGLGFSLDGGDFFSDGTTGIDPTDRTNWSTPIAMDLQNPKTLYTGTFRVYKTTNHMANWAAISPDLTYGNGGRVGTISTIDVSPVNSSVILAGTDDARVWITTNGGTNWTAVDTTLPHRWITRVTCDPVSENIAYVTLSGSNVYDFGGHIFRTTDYGASWTNIGTTLPDVPLNDVVVDPQHPSTLYIATDLNVMYTTDLGGTWQILGDNFPPVPVHDITLHNPSRKLFAFTHGRSIWSIELPVTGVNEVAGNVPQKFSLSQNYPNPFNPTTVIRYTLPANNSVSLKIFDVNGKEVATLVNEQRNAGTYQTEWNAAGVASGTYFYKLTAGGFSETKKMIVVK